VAVAAPLDWTTPRPDRGLPTLPVPTLADLGRTGLLDGQRRLAGLFTARVVLGLVLVLASLARGWWPLVVPATGLLYASALTLVHHLIHGPLGLTARSRHLLLTVVAALVAESGHALEATHLAHHRLAPDPTLGPRHRPAVAGPDPEGYIEGLAWSRLLPETVRFRYRLLLWGRRHGEPGRRRRLNGEAAVVALVYAGALALLPMTPLPAAYLASVAVVAAGFAVVAARGPQTNWGRPVASPLVRVRAGRVSSALFLSHDRHLEHHAYPEVPLPRLRRLDGPLAPHLDALPLVEVRLP